MKTQTVVFQDPIEKFEVLLRRIKDCDPIRMKTTSERKALRKEIKLMVPSDKGLYVLYEDDRPLYVGRTDKMAERLLGHGRNPSLHKQSSATFALILAKQAFKKHHRKPHGLFSKELTQDLKDHPAKINLWKQAVERVKRMSARVVEVAHPHEQAVFEVYIHERLETPFNSFANH